MGAFLQCRTSEKKNSSALLLSLISMNNNVFLTLKEFSTSILYKGKGTSYIPIQCQDSCHV